jgi:hypothetical protein
MAMYTGSVYRNPTRSVPKNFPRGSIDIKFELIGQQIRLRSNKEMRLQLHANFQREYEIAPSFISALSGAGA